MKHIWKIFLVAVALVTAMPSFAVTDKEMEQARAIAAKHYLRYANNGSDYLDKLSPTSVGELSKSLKPKEQENLKAFNAVVVPKDYASWDKAKLVEYWSSAFFKQPGLKEDGKKCLSILAKNLNKLSVSAPQAPKANSQAAETKPAEAKPAEATSAETKPAEATSPAQNQEAVNPTQTSAEPQAELHEETVADAVAQADADAGLADEQPKKSSNTGWYIGILVVLVGVVIWLVMYASKSMKESGANISNSNAGEKEIREAKKLAKEEQNKMREQYANSLTSKNDEIKQLKAKCEALDGQLETARKEADKARRELEMAKREIASLRQAQNQQGSGQDRTSQNPIKSRHEAQAAPQEKTPEASAAAKPQAAARPGGLPPLVFLSYVNQKGLFTKASRTLNVETSVYRMDIPDGKHGNFRVVNDPEILDRLLENPEHWLAGGCTIENPDDVDIAVEIVTLQAGEAVFADNTCRVVKKAKIKFI